MKNKTDSNNLLDLKDDHIKTLIVDIGKLLVIVGNLLQDQKKITAIITFLKNNKKELEEIYNNIFTITALIHNTLKQSKKINYSGLKKSFIGLESTAAIIKIKAIRQKLKKLF